jgi:hypothetical protein
MVKMVSIRLLKLDDAVSVVEKFPLEQWKEAFDAAAEKKTAGQLVVFKP